MQTVIQLQQHRVLCIAVEHAPEKHTPAATRCSRNDFPVPALPVKNTFSPDRTSCITRSCNMRALSMPIVMQASMPERTSTQLHDTTLHLFIAQLGADSVVCCCAASSVSLMRDGSVVSLTCVTRVSDVVAICSGLCAAMRACCATRSRAGAHTGVTCIDSSLRWIVGAHVWAQNDATARPSGH